MTASAHIITAVIGSGVLSLSWALAQLGWIAGIIALLTFSLITLFTSVLLTNGYRSPDPITGRRNYNYIEVVKNNLGNMIAGFLSFINNLSYASHIHILPFTCQPHNPCDVRGKMTNMQLERKDVRFLNVMRYLYIGCVQFHLFFGSVYKTM